MSISQRHLKYFIPAFLLLMSGCSMLFGVQAYDEKLYQIPNIHLEPSAFSRHPGARLSIRPTAASQILNSQRILFSSDGVEQGFYQFANWAEPPPKRFTTLLVQAFEASGIFDSVSLASSSAGAELQLVTEILEYIHDTSSKPGNAKIRVRVELVNLATRELIGQRTFVKNIAVESYDARGAVEALTLGIKEILSEMLDWTAKLSF